VTCTSKRAGYSKLVQINIHIAPKHKNTPFHTRVRLVHWTARYIAYVKDV